MSGLFAPMPYRAPGYIGILQQLFAPSEEEVLLHRFKSAALGVTLSVLAESKLRLETERNRYGLVQGQGGAPLPGAARSLGKAAALVYGLVEPYYKGFFGGDPEQFKPQEPLLETILWRYPIIAAALPADRQMVKYSWGKPKQVLKEHGLALELLTTLSTAPSDKAFNFVKDQVDEKLEAIDDISKALSSGEDLDLWRLPRIAAMTKVKLGWVPGSHEAAFIDEELRSEAISDVIDGVALAVLSLCLTLLGPATGGVTLVLAAGLSAVDMVESVKQYMLQSDLINTDLDRARALSEDEPSLLWVALAFMGAYGDVADAGKALRSYRRVEDLYKQAKYARTATQGDEARDQLAKLHFKKPLGSELLADLADDGRQADVATKLKTVEEASHATAAEIADSVEAPPGGLKVHVQPSGRTFLCGSPCTEIRTAYAWTLAKEPALLDELNRLELAARAAPKEQLRSHAKLIEEFARRLRDRDLSLRARDVAKALPGLYKRFPILRRLPLDAEAIARVIGKKTPDHVKGQLLEEFVYSRVRQLLKARSGKPWDEFPANAEFFPGFQLSDAEGAFSDGIIALRKRLPDGKEVLQILAVCEAKSGRASSKGLQSARTPLHKLTDEGLRDVRAEAIQQLRDSRPELWKLRTADIDSKFTAEVDAVVDTLPKTEAGQAVQDIERIVEFGEVTVDTGKGTKVTYAVTGGRVSTSVIAWVPSDVPTGGLLSAIGDEIKDGTVPGQGIRFLAESIELTADALKRLADELTARTQ